MRTRGQGNTTPDGKQTKHASDTSAQETRASTARTRVEKLRKKLDDASTQLDGALEEASNYMIFSRSDEQTGTADVAGGNLSSLTASESNATRGFAVIAGLRRSRLKLGTDLRALYDYVSNGGRLISWCGALWTTTAIVTETLEVEHIQYFTAGKSQQATKFIAELTPSQIGLSAVDLLELKIKVALADERLSSFANRAMLSEPCMRLHELKESLSCEAVKTANGDFMGLLQCKPEGTWTTLWAVGTSPRFLRKSGRFGPR